MKVCTMASLKPEERKEMQKKEDLFYEEKKIVRVTYDCGYGSVQHEHGR
mgnify:CR=1 FL=1